MHNNPFEALLELVIYTMEDKSAYFSHFKSDLAEETHLFLSNTHNSHSCFLLGQGQKYGSKVITLTQLGESLVFYLINERSLRVEIYCF